MADYDDDFDENSPDSRAKRSNSNSPVTSGSPTPSPQNRAADKQTPSAATNVANKNTNNAASPASPSSYASSSPANSPPKKQQQSSSNHDPDVEAEHSQARNKSSSRNGTHHNNHNNSHGAVTTGSTKLPPLPPGGVVAAARYPGMQHQVPVVDYLDTSKALVKSNKPVTKPHAPRLADPDAQAKMKQLRVEHRAHNDERTVSIVARRDNERNYLKAQYEFEREKRNAEKIIYQRERAAQWSHRLATSPLGVDLVADSERIQEEVSQREAEERRRRRKAELHRRKIKNDIVVKALAEVPLLDEARRQKREMLEDERMQRALRDVQRVESVQARKLRDLHEIAELRMKKLESRRSPSNTAHARH